MSAESHGQNTSQRIKIVTSELACGEKTDFVILQSSKSQVILRATKGSRPQIIYFGEVLANTEPDELALLSTRQWAFGGEDIVLESSFYNELGSGIGAPSGLIVDRRGQNWATSLLVEEVEQISTNSLQIMCEDSVNAIRAVTHFELDAETHVLELSTKIENLGDDELTVHWCSVLCVPIDQQFSILMGFSGRWANEFQTNKIPKFHGSYVRENKSGRTSHDNFPGLIALTPHTTEEIGPALGFHLGWSGNNQVRADKISDGRSFVQMGELFHPNEITLLRGESYTSPVMYAASSTEGLNDLSQQFHSHVANVVMGGRAKSRTRPVHFNTWEAIYFDHSESKLNSLANLAATVGAERFVLDDGWFGQRRSDAAGLGDWDVSKDVYPNGLEAFSKRVRDLGMEFGLWFEPEMVNPDSELFRAHPHWILEAPGVSQIPFRNQNVLNLTMSEVFDYLFGKITKLITDLDIAYIKWDMNRVVHHPGSAGRGVIHKQTHAVYALMQKLRDAHPNLEIESCASGGGRADYGVLRRTDRIWTSDNNDALERQTIQRGASYFFPLSVTGSHVGPKVCHITGRTLEMAMRASTAIFGHMGLELDLSQETPEDLGVLKRAIALHKQYRQLVHSGEFYRIDTPSYLNAMGVVANDKSEAIYSCATLSSHKEILPERLKFQGLDKSARYRTKIIWPSTNISITQPSIIDTANLLGAGSVFSGEALASYGLQLPLVRPESCLIFHLSKET